LDVDIDINLPEIDIGGLNNTIGGGNATEGSGGIIEEEEDTSIDEELEDFEDGEN